jgi:glycosyltransferase involved in cell wall biosynthesis
MRILFIDPSRWQYTVDAPYERPLGGSQSALCYLAAELAQLGHSVTLINGITTESESRGVRQRNLEALGAPGFSDSFDVGIVLNLACGHNLRRDLNVKIPLILWNQHAHDQDAIQKLSRSREQREWSAFAFVSDWQRGCFEKVFSLPSGKTNVMRNAVSPAFAKFLKVDPWFMTGGAPVLFYTSTPFRGLDVLLDCFPHIRQSVPDVRLRIFSSMQVYQVPAEADRYRELYETARNMAGVEYISSVSQTQLAQELVRMAALAYPSTFAETSCIAVTEAMAAGAAVYTTRLGALPETAGVHATMIDWQPDKTALASAFAELVIRALQEARENPQEAMALLAQRRAYIQENYLWPDRAREWDDWLAAVIDKGDSRPL